MKRQLRVAAFHDISCAGRCSLTVALPIISAAGIEVSIVPTAVLSTHTGGLSGYTYRDLSCDLIPIINHWKTLDLKFDALYSGFLGSAEQIDIMSQIFDSLKTRDNLIIIDPVMADEGSLYKVYDKSYPQGMKKLCKKADIIVPNITEAALLTDMPYTKGPYKE
ncbi:MAG: bifunctional hydroxymethylpyrimidine kinase/phosphomethylpyrimidine kinase, partial [Clostridia bacterium]|nr:bifunctional hydroxymethylpyrimidine kinase/phosphomethylpyrimidine kinase [Clostridia bacterium]